MAKAKRQRRTSIRTMQADNALKALEDLERAERPEPEPERERREDGTRAAVPETQEE